MAEPKSLHIICHDVPSPPDYGGVFDLYYKIKTLHGLGVGVKLHCFLHKRPAQDELNKYCSEVNYYPRKTGWKSFSVSTPYIVKSRSDKALLEKLGNDDDPVLMEGIHCTAFLDELKKQNRKIFLRLHNVESAYYNKLFRCEKNFFKKLYFFAESRLLKKYEKNLPRDLPVFTVSEADAQIYSEQFGKKNVQFLPVFVPFNEIKGSEGMGNFCLYHANLSVNENERAAVWLLDKVFTKIRVPFVIAGKNPTRRLNKMAHLCQHTCLVANPSEKEMNDLVSKAHINIIPSFNNTGIKLKLIHALFEGRHCVVNDAAVNGSGLDGACHSGNNAAAIASIISQLYHQPFAEEEIALRKKMLLPLFNNEKNARQLIQWIW